MKEYSQVTGPRMHPKKGKESKMKKTAKMPVKTWNKKLYATEEDKFAGPKAR